MLLIYSPTFLMFGMLLASLLAAVIIGILAVSADKIVRGPPKSLMGLKASMLTTVIVTFMGSIAVIYLVGAYFGLGADWLYSTVALVAIFMVLQWLMSPILIKAIYHTRTPKSEEVWLVNSVADLSKKAGLKEAPRVLIAEVSAPNAFAFGAPLSGNYVAVTRGLLNLLPREEIEAVLGHELGHLKHRDVAALLAISLIPSAIFFLGRMLLTWGWLAGNGRERSNGPLLYVAIGAILFVAGFLFQFLVTHFSRLREYFADSFSAKLTGNPRLLQRGLARLTLIYENNPRMGEEINKSAAMLFIVNYFISMTGGFAFEPSEYWFPNRRKTYVPPKDIDIDAAVEELMKKKESAFLELFSSHPSTPKRLRFLENLRREISKI
ncbi:MAG: zinc metalloprotease HtpX [Fervidicoccaceae archaeon]